MRDAMFDAPRWLAQSERNRNHLDRQLEELRASMHELRRLDSRMVFHRNLGLAILLITIGIAGWGLFITLDGTACEIDQAPVTAQR